MPSIVLGVSGSIAAYKAADLASQLVRAGYDVYPILTPGASRFIGAITLSALTGKPCPSAMFDELFPGEIAHIHLARLADLFAIVPASMDIMAKLAHGLADDMLTAATMATKAPVILAPGMNTAMWENPATQANLDKLVAYGYRFVDPVSGRLACRTEGVGKMAEVDTIFRAICGLLVESKAWAGKQVLVTAGPTREPIDPVRYLTNRSSGKMGYSLAEAAARMGAKVTLVTGPVSIPAPAHPGITVDQVLSADEMESAAMKHFGSADAVFAAAAVADYRPAKWSGAKIKKAEQEIELPLTRNPDILAGMGRAKQPGQVLVGFAAETDNVERNARAKLESKNLDFVVANDVTRDGAGFDVDTNIALVLGRDGSRVELPLMSKHELAEKLLEMARPLVG